MQRNNGGIQSNNKIIDCNEKHVGKNLVFSSFMGTNSAGKRFILQKYCKLLLLTLQNLRLQLYQGKTHWLLIWENNNQKFSEKLLSQTGSLINSLRRFSETRSSYFWEVEISLSWAYAKES